MLAFMLSLLVQIRLLLVGHIMLVNFTYLFWLVQKSGLQQLLSQFPLYHTSWQLYILCAKGKVVPHVIS